MENSNHHIAELSNPISLHDMPYTLDIRSILSYARTHGKEVSMLSEEEKRKFLISNPSYRKKSRLGWVAAL